MRNISPYCPNYSLMEGKLWAKDVWFVSVSDANFCTWVFPYSKAFNHWVERKIAM